MAEQASGKRVVATPAEVAEWLQVTTERLRVLRKTQRGPAYIKVGREVRYLWPDVHKWALAQRTVHRGR